ncbi:MAG: hypothetical protein CMJ62_21150 [Planctomycetaceae bacterium]|nr:hypothetical protein [Planctomycetaceae bacterium]|tara:strand:+ start:15564 stop:16157 length:594 start_codon:yes stop_codon:yes gene_type:complete
MNRTHRRSVYGKTYTVVDIWHAIRTTFGCWLTMLIGFNLIGTVLVLLLLSDFRPALWVGIWFCGSLIAASGFGWRVWQAQSAGIRIDPASGALSFSADDLENSLHDILSLRRFFDHAHRIQIAIDDIQRLDNDTQRIGQGRNRGRRYGLNLSGDFGSCQLMFSHKQKRDECRALLVQVVRRTKGRTPSFDPNIAFPE